MQFQKCENLVTGYLGVARKTNSKLQTQRNQQYTVIITNGGGNVTAEDK